MSDISKLANPVNNLTYKFLPGLSSIRNQSEIVITQLENYLNKPNAFLPKILLGKKCSSEISLCYENSSKLFKNFEETENKDENKIRKDIEQAKQNQDLFEKLSEEQNLCLYSFKLLVKEMRMIQNNTNDLSSRKVLIDDSISTIASNTIFSSTPF